VLAPPLAVLAPPLAVVLDPPAAPVPPWVPLAAPVPDPVGSLPDEPSSSVVTSPSHPIQQTATSNPAGTVFQALISTSRRADGSRSRMKRSLTPHGSRAML